MKSIRETIVAGRTIYQNIKVSSGKHRDKRKGRRNITREKVKKNNERLACRNLMLLLDANFDSSSMMLTLTYRGVAPGQDEAAKSRAKFIRKLRRSMAQSSTELKYVAVTEYLHKRIHHHIVVNTPDLDLIQKIWNEDNDGFVGAKHLDASGEYLDLACYLVKETSKTYNSEGTVHHQRYAASRNLLKPVVKREYVDASAFNDDPEPLEGYYIPADRCRRYEHPVTGIEHIEYVQIAIDDPRKYKVWPRGKRVSGKEYFTVTEIEDQVRMEWLDHCVL